QQRALYRTLKKTYQLDSDRPGVAPLVAANAPQRTQWMRTLLSAPALLGLTVGSPKDAVISELLETLQERKVLIFTWHKAYAHYLADWLDCDVITGDSPNREQRVEAFRRNDKQVLVATIGAI